MSEMFKKGTIYIAPNLNVTEFLIEDREDELGRQNRRAGGRQLTRNHRNL